MIFLLGFLAERVMLILVVRRLVSSEGVVVRLKDEILTEAMEDVGQWGW